MSQLPTGTVTFLFSDIEGSTRLLRQFGDHYAQILNDHRRLLRSAFLAHHGQEVDSQGEEFFFAFPRARDAVEAAVAAQRALAQYAWPNGVRVYVRMGLHTGESVNAEDGYIGMAVHRAARICAAAHGGQILLSLATREIVADDLPEGAMLRDLGDHLLKDLPHPQRLFQVVALGLPSDFPPLRTMQSIPNNLPRQLTSFIGRRREIREVNDLLIQHSLITLTGAGGCGKTRLALQAAGEVLDLFPDGVWHIELAPLSHSGLIPQAIVSALGAREELGRALTDTLSDYLRPRTLLLILDNVEHLLSATAALADMLAQRCPNMRILTTCREPLRVAGERIYHVHPFPVPSTTMPLSELVQSDAVRLFAERARAARPAFTLTLQNAAAVAQICRLVDGSPLAIELAAARVNALSAEQIASRLEDKFQLVSSGHRTALPRHQTLRAAMDWSYDSLSDPERVLLRRLSVFVGGFTLDAAEGVCAGDGIETGQIVDTLSYLVDKSLVLADVREGEPRYRLLEMMRQYCREKLLESREARVTNRRHQDWFLALAERAEPLLMGPDETSWLNRLDAEHDNFRNAFACAQAAGEHEEELRLAGALGFFWYIRGHLSEGRERLRGALLRSTAAPRLGIGKALVVSGRLAYCQGDYEAAAPLCERSLAIFRESGDRWGIGLSLDCLGTLARVRGEYESSRTLHDESLKVFQELGGLWGIATSLLNLGLLATKQSDYAAARTYHEQSLRIFRVLDHKRGTAHALDNLGEVASAQGDYRLARQLLEESLEIFRELGDQEGIGWALLDLGRNEFALRADVAAARPLLEESLRTLRQVGAKRPAALALRTLGLVALSETDYEGARPLFEESLKIFRQLGDRQGIGYTLGYMGLVALGQGDVPTARPLFEDSLKIFEAMGNREDMAWALYALGKATCLQGDQEEAAFFYSRSMNYRQLLGDKQGMIACLEGLAAIAHVRGDLARAARLYGAAEALRTIIDIPLPSTDDVAYQRDVSTLESELGGDAFAAALDEGRVMTLEQAIEYAGR